VDQDSFSYLRLAAVVALAASMLLAGAAAAAVEDVTLDGIACSAPELHCPDADCPVELITRAGNVIEPRSGRAFYLDYPCGLALGDAVTFVLNVHGTAAPANWHRHYFPVHDFKDRYELIVATPQAEVYEYEGCRDGRVLADVIRREKGHTEGLEPNVTEHIVRLMVGAAEE
jgi:hypothetical protein